MIYKTYNCNSFNVHTIKTDKFKTCHMEITFSKPMVKEEATASSFLVDILAESSKKYQTRKELVIRLEELYKTTFYGLTNRIGETLNSIFILDFIAPEFIEEKDYLENVLKLPFEAIQKPNAINEEFDLKTFNIIKDRLKREIKGVFENPMKLAFKGALQTMDENSHSSYSTLGTIEDLEKITPSSLYQMYKNLYKDNKCDIYIIGDLDMDNVVSLIKKYFKNRIISQVKNVIYVDNKSRKKEIVKTKDSPFIQANLVVLFNTLNLTKREKDIVIHVYNYILGNGGLTSKLYISLREKNSLCYGVTSAFLKYDNILAVHLSLENDQVKKAISLIKKCIKSMIKGEIEEEKIEDAKSNLMFSLNLSMDNNIALLNNYVFNIIDDLPPIDERKEAIKSVTKKEIIEVAKKIKINTVYVLNGGKNERD